MELIIIIAVIAFAAIFMTLRIVKTLRGKRPSCCSGEGAAACPHCAERAAKG
ncbi:hypothetical protein FACS1894147_08680 [Spirochaetia bacterium]|nr:hypothetical protein FACS1894147_08680 [Spirochaetia bacterium]